MLGVLGVLGVLVSLGFITQSLDTSMQGRQNPSIELETPLQLLLKVGKCQPVRLQ